MNPYVNLKIPPLAESEQQSNAEICSTLISVGLLELLFLWSRSFHSPKSQAMLLIAVDDRTKNRILFKNLFFVMYFQLSENKLMNTEIVQAESKEQIEQARELFREYEAWFGLNLCFQNFDEEVANLPGKYAAPDGRLFLAFADENLAGCIALRKLEDEICEMKRLFVRDEFRGRKIGVLLIEKLFEEAKKIGYKKMRLDTFPSKMGKAVSLYESYGFPPIAPYYHNPYGETLFMELEF